MPYQDTKQTIGNGEIEEKIKRITKMELVKLKTRSGKKKGKQFRNLFRTWQHFFAQSVQEREWRASLKSLFF